MMQHEDAQQDKDMIKSILQKIIADMDGLESDRISKKPAVAVGHIEVAKPADGMAMGGYVDGGEVLNPSSKIANQHLEVDHNGEGHMPDCSYPDHDPSIPCAPSKHYDGKQDMKVDHAGEGHEPVASFPNKMAYGGEMKKHPHNKPEDNDSYEPGDANGQTHEEGDLDPSILKQLMDQAGQSDDEGSLPEDREDELPDDIKKAVRKKRENGMPK